MNNYPLASSRPAGRSGAWIFMVAAIILLAACSSDDQEDNSPQDAPDAAASNSASTRFTLPNDFPEQIPLPEGYLIVRNSSGDWEPTGREIALNIALPGSVDEWAKTYQAAIESEFEAVEFREDSSGLRWRFHGHGFEHAILYLNDNQGYLDRGSTDSTHLPVMLSLQLTERRIR